MYRGVLLYGDSGSGKSSLVNAGLIPAALELGFAPERIRVQPRAGEELVVERIAGDDDETAALPSRLALDSESSARTVFGIDAFLDRLRGACEDGRPLLIFDQLEEIVTLFDAPEMGEVQRRLVDLFAGLVRGSLPVKVLFSFREDYLGRIRELLSSCPELVDQSLRIAPPAVEVLPTIIGGPFVRYPDHFQRPLSPALSARLVTALAERFGTGQLSLSEVQTVCLRLWQSDNPDALLDQKGPQGLLEDYLGEALDHMPSELRPAAIALLSQMVTASGTRNVISASDLFQRVREAEGGDPEVLEQALERLSQSRLVRRERRRDLDLYEITSEFLVPWISRRREELRRLQDRRRERRRLRIFGSIAATLLLVVAVVAGLAVWALGQRNDARSAATAATSLALSSDAQPIVESRTDAALVLLLGALAPYGAGPASPLVARDDMITALETTRLQGVSGILEGHDGAVGSVAFSPDRRTIAAGAADGTVRLWDVTTRRSVATLASPTLGAVESVAFSPDGRLLAAGGDGGKVRLWDLTTDRPITTLLTSRTNRINTIAFSPDGRLLAAGGTVGRQFVLGGTGGTVWVWNVTSRQQVGPPITPHVTSYYSVGNPLGVGIAGIAFSPNGRTLAIADGGFTDLVVLWDVRKHRQLGPPLSLNAEALSVAFSPDGMVLAVGEYRALELWNVKSRRRLRSTLGIHATVYDVAFSPDGRDLAGRVGSDGRTVRLWKVDSGRGLASFTSAANNIVQGLAFNPDGRELVTGNSDGTVVLWDLLRAQQLGSPLPLHSGLASVAFSPDGHELAAGAQDGIVRLWAVSHGTQPATLAANASVVANQSPVLSLAFSRTGRELAAVTQDGRVRSWNTHTGASLISLPSLDKRAQVVALSPDLRRVATASGKGTVRVWSTHASRDLFSLSMTAHVGIASLAFSPNGRELAVGDNNGLVTLWDLGTRHRVHNLPAAAGSVVLGLAFSPDGRDLAEGSDDATARVWDVSTGRQLGSTLSIGPNAAATGAAAPIAFTGTVSVTFSPDRQILATNDYGIVRLWDVATSELIGLSLASSGLSSVAFSPGQNTLAVVGPAGAELWSGFLWGNFAELRHEVCGLVGGGLSRTEWARYAPGVAYQATCR